MKNFQLALATIAPPRHKWQARQKNKKRYRNQDAVLIRRESRRELLHKKAGR